MSPTSFPFSKSTLSLHRIISAFGERVASCEALQAFPSAADQAVAVDGFVGVLAAGGDEPALPAEKVAQRGLVKSDQQHRDPRRDAKDFFEHIHVFIISPFRLAGPACGRQVPIPPAFLSRRQDGSPADLKFYSVMLSERKRVETSFRFTKHSEYHRQTTKRLEAI